MSLICAISHEVPDHPVLSPVSGHIFERRLVEKFIAENGNDPMTGEPLTTDQLIEVKAPPLVKPKPPSATSIPAILKSLQVSAMLIFVANFFSFSKVLFQIRRTGENTQHASCRMNGTP